MHAIDEDGEVDGDVRAVKGKTLNTRSRPPGSWSEVLCPTAARQGSLWCELRGNC